MANIVHFKKYKVIIISVVVFLILDFSVLVFNYYISYKIAKNAIAINLAGQQRSLSQRITKNLLEFERAYDKARDYGPIIADIKSSMGRFDEILSAFDVGGMVSIKGERVFIEPVSDEPGRRAIETAKPMWAIYKNYTADVLNEFEHREHIKEDVVTIFFRESIINDVVLYVTHNNLALLEVVSDLNEAVGNTAEEKVRKLRIIQSLAIFLAVINFFFIIFFALKNLRKIDTELEFAKAELHVMLNTITEGIFLLDSNLVISEQYSKEMEIIFNGEELSGKSLLFLLNKICHDFNEKGVGDFLQALFDKNKNMKVLNLLNPLQKVLVKDKNKTHGLDDKRYLRFSYSRIEADKYVERILVRVVDISKEVLHEQTLEKERDRQFKQMHLISALMNSNADMLPIFFQRSFYCFDHINGILKSPISDSRELFGKVERIDSLLNDFRVEAKKLGLESLTNVSSDLQTELEKIKGKKKLSVDDFYNFSLVLDNLVSHTESIYKFSNKILSENAVKIFQLKSVVSENDIGWAHLSEFSEIVAEKERKDIEFVVSGLNDHLLPKKMLRFINSIIVQLTYHSIAVSIETPQRRIEMGKPSFGLVDVRLVKKKSGGYYLTIRNDGTGLNVNEVRASVVDGGAIRGIPSGKMTKKQMLFLLFYSYNPEENKLLFYDNELVSCDQMMKFIADYNVKFDIRSVDNEGSVFEFMFPVSTL
ncbi:hypothetical protein AB835_03235 [Candidatus Endobugula sertula]|uniref:Histidine kinase domain-containing protein n=1 Tax=Candidatus Endobugula sertula TaxID=62101 RepID=A0A1D2QSH4_9GAMM|nr:hypothetical protein AB835_03235 [Candidatus Endobugula sertula]